MQNSADLTRSCQSTLIYPIIYKLRIKEFRQKNILLIYTTLSNLCVESHTIHKLRSDYLETVSLAENTP